MGTKAKESQHIQKARKKLEKQLAREKKLVNSKAIIQMKKAIQIWINRHEAERVKLKERWELFDENRHPVGVKSKFVSHLMGQLEKEAAKSKSFKPLIGRIKR